MIVMIDGKEVAVQNDIRVIHKEIIYGWNDDNTELEGDLHIVLNCEGMVMDLIGEDGEVFDTMSKTYGELAEWVI